MDKQTRDRLMRETYNAVAELSPAFKVVYAAADTFTLAVGDPVVRCRILRMLDGAEIRFFVPNGSRALRLSEDRTLALSESKIHTLLERTLEAAHRVCDPPDGGKSLERSQPTACAVR